MMTENYEENQSKKSVRFIRLNTGEDLVSEIEYKKTETSSYYLLTNPMKIVYMVGDNPNLVGVSMAEWVFPKICSDQEFVIFASDILTFGRPNANIIELYEKIKRYEKENNESEIGEDVSDEEVETVRDLMREHQAAKKKLLH